MLPVNSAPGVATLSSEDKIKANMKNSCCHTLRSQACSQTALVATRGNAL